MRTPTTELRELWRFPVKSLAGERLAEADLQRDGIAGDRVVHVRAASGRVITARRRPALLGLHARLGPGDVALIDGERWDAPPSLAAVRAASDPDARLEAFAGPDDGQRFDVLPLTVVSDGMLDAVGVDPRRFRANLVIGGVPGLTERDWAGRALRIGEALIGVRGPRQRCVMTTFHPDTQVQDPGVLRRIVREFDARVALDCWIISPGRVTTGDPVRAVPLPNDVVPPAGNGGRRAS